jgi:NADPH:quinone reductase-like Zn-dependent oxidoreductase
MRAVLLEKKGPPEVLVEREVAVPEPAPDEVRIRVQAAGINFADILQRLGLYGNAPKMPYIPGFEVSGVISALGPEASGLQVGDRVVALTRFGGYAEEVCAPRIAALPVPDGLDLTVAASIPVNYLTAWFCLKTMGNVRKGERVLIHNGAGGVGTAAVQLAREDGAEIFATASSQRKLEFLRDLGVDHPINYRTTNFAEEIRRIAGKRSLDLILDAVGGETTLEGYKLLAPLGRLVSYGMFEAAPTAKRNVFRAWRAWRRTPRFNPIQMIGRNTGIFGFHLALLEGKHHLVAEAFAEILEMIVAGRLRPIISESFPLTAAGAAEGHRFIHERRNIGKVLLVNE